MSKHDAFSTIDLSMLTNVCGGLDVEGEGEVDVGAGGGNVKIKGKYHREPYESCLDRITSRKKPDGSPDWTPQDVVGSCGLPKAG